MIEANNVTVRKRVAVAATHLRDTVIDWYKVDKVNISQYADRKVIRFIQ